MSDQHNVNRRLVLTALAGLTLSGLVLKPAAAANIPVSQGNGQILVVYFSRSGNTRVIAGVIHRQLKTGLFEIVPAAAYPEDYFQTVEQAKKQRDQGVKPALKNNISNIERYKTIYLGFPIWGTTVPPLVQTFLSSHNLNNKLLIPFITHGGYGIGNSEEVLASLAPSAKIEKPLIIECDQERKTTETVTDWLASIRS